MISLQYFIRIIIMVAICICAYNASTLLQALPFFKNTPTLETTTIKHLGVIMDGNRRWAKKHRFDPWIGHRKGVDPLKQTVQFCLKHNIKELTLYTLSLDNLENRPAQELQYLFDVLATELASKELHELLNHGIKVRFIGDRNQFPQRLCSIIEDIEQKTAHQQALIMNFLFCYGGRQELVACAQSIAQAVKNGEIDPDNIDDPYIRSRLWSGNVSDPDLIIRTGNVSRLSSYLPYQSVYSELCFLDCYWPDITETHLIEAVWQYENTQHKKKFGG
jgi:undecaprenyl diphosphate synthase